MKKLLRFLILAALLVPLGANAQVSCPGFNVVTVSNADASSGTTSYFPGFSYYNYSYSEVIVPAEQLEGIGTIKALQFKPESTTAGNYFTNCEIYLAVTSEDDLSAGWSTEGASLELVWEGDMSYTTTDWQTIVFDTPFDYDGASNLLVAVRRNHGFYLNGSTFASCSTSVQLGRYAYRDGSPYTVGALDVTGTATSNVGWYKFIGCDNAEQITCFRVRDLYVDDITTNGGTLHWLDTANSDATYTIYNMADTSIIESDITDTFFTITTLASNTVYNLAVVANCDVDDESSLTRISFRTGCGPIDTLPWFTDFEDLPSSSYSNPEFIPCWNRFENGSYHTPYVNSNYARSGSHDLYFYSYSGSSYGTKWLAALPIINTEALPMNTLQVRFWARTYSGSTVGTVQVGVMTDFYDEDSFIPIQTITPGQDYEEYTVAMGDAPDSAVCMAFKYLVTSSTSHYVIIDDLTIEEQPSCPPIANLTVLGTTTGGALLSWGYQPGTPGTPEAYNITYVNLDDSTAAPVVATTENNYIVINGLTPATRYEFTVTPDCGEDNGMGAAATVAFRTVDFGCAVMDLTTTNIDTIGDLTSTSTSSYFPTYSCYNYSLGQQIFTGEEIGASGMINSISVLPTSVVSAERDVEIYMGHTTETSATNFLWPDDLTLVYTGTTDFVANEWYEFELNTPFAYNNSANLVIIFRDMTGSYDCSNSFSVHTATTNASHYVYQDSGPYAVGYSGGSNSSVRNNMVFNMSGCAEAATCSAPQIMVITTDEPDVADLIWAPGANETEWDVYYRLYGDTVWTEEATGVTATNYTISDLIPGATYEFRVVNPCSEGDFQDVAMATMPCAEFAPLPLTENFQTHEYGIFDRSCWVIGSTNLGTQYPYPQVVSLSGDEENHLCLFFNGAYMVLPRVEEMLTELEISFKLTQGGDSVRFLMGLLPDQNAPISSMIVLDTLIRSNFDTTMSTINYSYRFDTIDDEYAEYCIAFWDAFNDNYSFLDDIVLDYIPACGVVSELSAQAAATEATISWNVNGDNATGYMVEYGPRGFAPGTGVGTTLNVMGSPVTITGLNHSSNYDVYVFTECEALGAVSAASQVVMFSTECQPYTTFPYFTDFENIMSAGSTATDVLPNCWLADPHSSSQPYIYYTSSTTYTSSPTHCLYFNNESVVALPEMGVPLNTLMVTFHEYNSYPENYRLIIGALTVDDNDTVGFTDLFEPIDTLLYEGSGYQFDFVSYLADYTGTGNRIALKAYNTAGNSYTYHYIDDLTIDQAPACIAPQHVHLTNLTNVAADLAWNISQAPNYNIEYGPVGFTPGTGATATANTRAVSLTGLTPFTTYEVRIVGVCDAATLSDTSVFTFTTMRAAPVTNLPYICTFADSAMANAWELVGDGQASSWYVGTAEHHGDADNMGLYVSSDTGATNTYNYSSMTAAYTYRTFTLDSLDYAVGFDWKANGEGNYDYLRAFLVPDSYIPIPGKLPDGSTSSYSFATVTPADMIDLGGKMNLDTTWNNVLIPFHIDNPGNYKLLFLWANDVSVGNQPPACIDNIKLFQNTCPWPENIVVAEANTTSLVVDWTDMVAAASWQIEYGPAGYAQGTSEGTVLNVTAHPVTITGLDGLTSYDVYVRAICSDQDTGFWAPAATLTTALCDGAINIDNFVDSTSTASSSYSPIGYSFYNYSYVQTIIPASDLAGLSSEITAFSFLPLSTTSGDYFTNMTVYMANVEENDLSAGFIVPDSLHTFYKVIDSADFSYGETEWQLHGFDSAFHWDGYSNVLFAVKRDHGSYSSGASFRAHTDTVDRIRYAYTDTAPFDITSPGSGYTNSTIGDLRLISCPVLNCDAPAIDSVLANENDIFVRFTGEAAEFEVAIVEGAWAEPTVVTSITDTFYTFYGLTDWTAYTIGVRAVCGTNIFSEWTLVSATTLRHPCAVPTEVTVTDPTFDGATVSWTIGETESQWEVNVSCTSPQYDYTYTVEETPTLVVTGLDNGVTYNVMVRAMCDSNWYSEWTAPVALTTATCPQVTGVSASDITATSATINWTSTGAESYEVEYGIAGFQQGSGTGATSTTNSLNVTGLEEQTSYDVYVRGICGEGITSLWSAKYTFTTPEQGSEGIDDVENGIVTLFPNPASTTVTVRGIEGESIVTVVDLNGREVFKANANSNLTIDLTGFAKGAYFVRITGERTTAIRKLVVR